MSAREARPPVEWWKENAARFNLKVSGKQWQGPCPNPACDADHDGFHVNINDGLIGCRKCNDFGAIMRAVGWKPNGKAEPLSFGPKKRQSWTYETVHGETMRAIRTLTGKTLPNGKPEKRYRCEPSGVQGPYLPLGNAVDGVVIVEGETCYDAICRAGRIGMTWCLGASNWDKTDWSALAGKSVVLWPDNDPGGRKAMRELGDYLDGEFGCDVRYVRVPQGKPNRWDAADTTPGEIVALIDAATHEQPTGNGSAKHGPFVDENGEPLDMPVFERAGDILTSPIDWLWRPWLARGQFHLLAGPGGVGKTALMIELAARLVQGKPPFTKPGKALMICLEGSWRYKMGEQIKAAGGHDAIVLRELVSGRRFNIATDLPLLSRAIKAAGNKFDLIVIDPVIQAAAAISDSHNPTQVRTALHPLEQLIRDADAACVGITHFNKGGAANSGPVSAGLLDRVLGSSVWGQIARMAWACWFTEQTMPVSGEYERCMGMIKTSLGTMAGHVPYDIEEDENDPDIARVILGPMGSETANVILGDGRPTKGEQAQTWLLNHSQPGESYDPAELIERAAVSGIAKRTLQRARKDMGWTSYPVKGGHRWQRPE